MAVRRAGGPLLRVGAEEGGESEGSRPASSAGCAGCAALGLPQPAGKPFATSPSSPGEGKDGP